MAERLNPLDVWFLHLEDDADMLHIGSVLVFEGPSPAYADLCAAYQARLDAVPRYRQVVRSVPLGLGRPVWVDDPHFNIGYHLRHTALPGPGGAEDLHNLVGRVMSQRLDRRRPLWEAWVVEGLEDGCWAVISKVHHCMVDGIAGTELTEAICDPPEGGASASPVPSRPHVPVPAPSPPALVLHALRERVAMTGRLLGSAGRAVRDPAAAARSAGAVFSGAATMLGLGRRLPPSSLSGPIGPHRRWDRAELDLQEVREVKRRLGCTVNDVVLGAVARGFSDLLTARGEADAEVRALIPVSTRPPDVTGSMDNRVAALFARIPVDHDDPLERLAAVRTEMGLLKTSGEAMAAAAIVQASGMTPTALLGPAMRLATAVVNRVGQRNVNTVITNVPGPQHPLFLMGRRALGWYPYVPIAEAVRIGVAALSYDGRIGFGVTGDFDHAADLAILTRGIEDGMADLRKAVGL